MESKWRPNILKSNEKKKYNKRNFEEITTHYPTYLYEMHSTTVTSLKYSKIFVLGINRGPVNLIRISIDNNFTFAYVVRFTPAVHCNHYRKLFRTGCKPIAVRTRRKYRADNVPDVIPQ